MHWHLVIYWQPLSSITFYYEHETNPNEPKRVVRGERHFSAMGSSQLGIILLLQEKLTYKSVALPYRNNAGVRQPDPLPVSIAKWGRSKFYSGRRHWEVAISRRAQVVVSKTASHKIEKSESTYCYRRLSRSFNNCCWKWATGSDSPT